MTVKNLNAVTNEQIKQDNDIGPPAGHGHISSPGSRAYFAWQAGELDTGALNQRESGKFFPLNISGVGDSFAPDDVANALPPPDGKIASANQPTGQMLDKPGRHWKKYEVRSGDTLDVMWNFTANHVTRRWNYFLTKEDWNPDLPLSRAQFESEPFYTVQLNLKPFWSHTDALKPPSPTVHAISLPKRSGYHVLLGVWEVADTANAFYQVVDLDFVGDQGGVVLPSTPTGLRAHKVTDKSVELTWIAPSNSAPIASYRITRNGTTTVDIEASNLSWTDNSVSSETIYNYFISAVGETGHLSAPSRAIQVTTLPEGGEDAPPAAPVNLHSMGETSHSVSLMWGSSISSAPVIKYMIYREGEEIQQVVGNQTSFKDSGLTPSSEYRYFVAALDQTGKLSVPSNVLLVRTKAQDNNDGTGDRSWKVGESYATNERARHNGKVWRCIQGHTVYTSDWEPGTPGGLTLWEVLS